MKVWKRLPIQRRARILSGLIFTIALILVFVTGRFFVSSMYELGQILNGIRSTETLETTLQAEDTAFRNLIAERTETNIEAFNTAAENTKSAVENLPFDYDTIGEERYAKTWNIRNAYESYAGNRNSLLAVDFENNGSIPQLYEIYEQLQYLHEYAQQLQSFTVEQSLRKYAGIMPFISRIPLYFAGFILLIMTAVFVHGHLLFKNVETERQLDRTKFDLLMNQINPHFLFNTLNSISGMAEIEDAGTTRKMIISLSNLFRYNLQRSVEFVSLRNELNIVQDYMYLQQMRFGERIQYSIHENADADEIRVPVFMLQPIVENAFKHGLRDKTEGGLIEITVDRKEVSGRDTAVVVISNTGAAISAERMAEIADREGNIIPENTGIGLGNIARRIYSIYEGGSVTVQSNEAQTSVTVSIPQS